jgi:hypothetical protein
MNDQSIPDYDEYLASMHEDQPKLIHCTICEKLLFGGLDTFGPIGKELCRSCFLEDTEDIQETQPRPAEEMPNEPRLFV